jgi:tripartite-type tricarboxylate transporter receptor subunit TctC
MSDAMSGLSWFRWRVIGVRALAVALLLGGLPTAGAAADTWPTRTVKLVVPYAAGGLADQLGRLLAVELSLLSGQSVVIENRPGVGGTVASEQVAHAAADGYTLLVSGIGSHVIAPALTSNVKYDPLKDFTHLAILGGSPTMLVLGPTVPVQQLHDFKKWALAQPKGVSWGSPGAGSHGHLIGEYFAQLQGLNMVHVGYKGAAQAIGDVWGGHIPAAFVTSSSAAGHIADGQLLGLAVSSASRLQSMPQVPTFAELGWPKLTAHTWFGLAGPASMPEPVVLAIQRAVHEVLRKKSVQTHMETAGIEMMSVRPDRAKEFVENERLRWLPVVQGLRKK